MELESIFVLVHCSSLNLFLTNIFSVVYHVKNETHDLRQVVPVHNSHVIALSQVCPNNLNGCILT